MDQPRSRSREAEDTVRRLTIKEILAEMKGKLMFTTQQRYRKDELIECIYQSAAAEDLQSLKEAALQKVASKTPLSGHMGQKHKRGKMELDAPSGEPSGHVDDTNIKCSSETLHLWHVCTGVWCSGQHHCHNTSEPDPQQCLPDTNSLP